MEAKSLRIVFMGTPEFAATSLRKLVAEGPIGYSHIIPPHALADSELR